MRKGWVETSLGEVAEVVGGGTPSTTNPAFWDGEIIWLTPTEVTALDGKVVSDSVRKITQAGLRGSGARLLPVGTVVLTSRASVGFVALAGTELTTNQGFQSLIPNKGIDSRFLMYWIQHNRSEFESRSAGSTFKEISKTNVKSIRLNLPPLSEQMRIVDLVSSVDAYIDALQQLADSVRVARNSIAENVVNTDFPKSQLLALGRLVTGSTPSTKRPEFWKPEEVMFLTPGDFRNQLLIAETARKVSSEGAVAGRILQPNSVVQVCIGATIGKVGIIEQSLITNQQINALEGLSKNDAYFAALMLSTHRMKSELIDISGKTTMPIISKSTWGSLEIPWPNDKVRQAVSEGARSIDEYEKQLNIAITATRKLRFGLLSDLLSGNHEIPASYDSLLGAA